MKLNANTRLFLLTIALTFGTSLMSQENIAPEPEKTKVNNFLQIENVQFPESLEEIDFEIKQNTIDVVINSPKYIFLTSKRKKVVNKNYKNYNSLNVIIKQASSKNFVAEVKISNWYSGKYDRKFSSTLSKYNLLTDLRMSIYELLYGKVFVRKNREKLIQYSAMRIKKINQLAKKRKKSSVIDPLSDKEAKKKLKEKAPNKETKKKDKEKAPKDSLNDSNAEDDSADEEANKKKKKSKSPEEELKKDELKKKKKESDSEEHDPNRNEKEKSKSKGSALNNEDGEQEVPKKEKDKPGDKRISAAIEKAVENNEDRANKPTNLFSSQDLFDEPPKVFINKNSQFGARLLYTTFNVSSSNYLLPNVTLDMSFIRFGADIVVKQEKVNPWVYEFNLLAGSSVDNEVTPIPAWRTLGASFGKYFFSNFIKLSVGLESSPFFFINVPLFGEGIQLYELDLLWVVAKAEIQLRFFRRVFLVGASYASSISVSSNIKNYSADAVRTHLYATALFTKKYGASFEAEGFRLTGTDQGQTAQTTGTNYSLNFITKFN